jgi:hypothetical protein
MIKGIVGGPGIEVRSGINSIPYINHNSGNPIQGMIRVWGNDLQVFDNNGWITLQSSYASVELAPDVAELIEWARKQRDQAIELEQLSEKYPAVKIAMENLNNAQAQLEITKILSKEQ